MIGSAAIVGISGVGKEYVREFQELGVSQVILVDRKDVLEKQIVGGSLSNTFPGHEFTVDLDPGFFKTLAVSPGDDGDAWARLQSPLLSPELVVFCTPPTPAGRAMLRYALQANPHNSALHVEKPWLMPGVNPYPRRGGLNPLEDLSVGYLYAAMPKAQQAAYITAPRQEGWRDHFGIVWDLLGHVVSVCPYEYRPLLHVFDLNESYIGVGGGGWWGSATYGLDSTFTVDDKEVKWNQWFHEQAVALAAGDLDSLCSAEEAYDIELTLSRLATEIYLRRFK